MNASNVHDSKNKFLRTLKKFIQSPDESNTYLDKTLQEFMDARKNKNKIKSPLKSLKNEKAFSEPFRSARKNENRTVITEESVQTPKLPKLNSMYTSQYKNPYSVLFFTDKSLDFQPEATFTSFDKMLRTENTSSFPLNTSNSVELDKLYNTDRSESSQRDLIEKQLKHNLFQQKRFQERMDKIQQQTIDEVEKEIMTKTRFLRKFTAARVNKNYDVAAIPTNTTGPAKAATEENNGYVRKPKKEMKKEDTLIGNKKFFEDTSSKIVKLYWQGEESRTYRPDIREGATFSYVRKKQKLFLYGGLSHDLMNTVSEFDLASGDWNVLKQNGEIPENGRSGHTCDIFKDKLIFFGGEVKYNKNLKMRECLNDVRIFNTTTFEWKLMRATGDVPDCRRNHGSAFLSSKDLLIYGGINSHNRYLNDAFLFSFETLKWEPLILDNERDEGIGFHRMLPIFRERIMYINLFRPFEYKKKKRKSFPVKIKEEGIYCFGGKTKQGEALNELRVLKIGKKPLTWIKLDTLGNPPPPRYGHSVNYYRGSNILIIYGGRNDANSDRGDDIILEDLSILNLETLNWCAVSFFGNFAPRVCNHSSVVAESQMFVFGGYTTRNFVNGDLNIFELDLKNAKAKFQEAEQRRKDPVNGLFLFKGPKLNHLNSAPQTNEKVFISLIPLPESKTHDLNIVVSAPDILTKKGSDVTETLSPKKPPPLRSSKSIRTLPVENGK